MGAKPVDNNNDNNNTVKFLYSYGGKILPRHTDGKLRYYGGHTRVLALHPSTSFAELMVKLTELCGSPVTLRCPLPNGDLDTLISVTSDEDLANIIEEYDRASSSLPNPLKIRAILSLPKKLLSPSPSSSSSAAHSPSGSPHSSAGSLRCSAAHRSVCRSCSPVPVACPIGFRNGAAKGCWYTRQLDGSPRFLYRGPHWNNYCH
ncbi:clustered mitochondria protein [Spatholobus suberectus]|nr:clustered mitochondria protein [Spatholobus suberectus]